MPTDISIDFKNDWCEKLIGEMKACGVEINEYADCDKICRAFYNTVRRMVTKKNRTVLKSKEFNCPVELEPGLNFLINKITAGEDINPHLSKYILKSGYSDKMMNDWGVFHFHLGTNIQKNGFVNKGDEILFARVDDDVVYFINIYRHGDWYKKDIIEILHNNWPNAISRFRMRGAVDIQFIPTEIETKQLRDNNYNTSIKTDDGTVYAPLGLGSACSGESTIANIFAIQALRYVEHLQNAVINEVAKTDGAFFSLKRPLDFHLQFKDGKACCFESTNGILAILADADATLQALHVIFNN